MMIDDWLIVIQRVSSASGVSAPLVTSRVGTSADFISSHLVDANFFPIEGGWTSEIESVRSDQLTYLVAASKVPQSCRVRAYVADAEFTGNLWRATPLAAFQAGVDTDGAHPAICDTSLTALVLSDALVHAAVTSHSQPVPSGSGGVTFECGVAAAITRSNQMSLFQNSTTHFQLLNDTLFAVDDVVLVIRQLSYVRNGTERLSGTLTVPVMNVNLSPTTLIDSDAVADCPEHDQWGYIGIDYRAECVWIGAYIVTAPIVAGSVIMETSMTLDGGRITAVDQTILATCILARLPASIFSISRSIFAKSPLGGEDFKSVEEPENTPESGILIDPGTPEVGFELDQPRIDVEEFTIREAEFKFSDGSLPLSQSFVDKFSLLSQALGRVNKK